MNAFTTFFTVYLAALSAGLSIGAFAFWFWRHGVVKAYRETVIGYHYSINEQGHWQQEPVRRCDLRRIQPNTPEEYVRARKGGAA